MSWRIHIDTLPEQTEGLSLPLTGMNKILLNGIPVMHKHNKDTGRKSDMANKERQKNLGWKESIF